jgi:hypothetical protein
MGAAKTRKAHTIKDRAVHTRNRIGSSATHQFLSNPSLNVSIHIYIFNNGFRKKEVIFTRWAGRIRQNWRRSRSIAAVESAEWFQDISIVTTKKGKVKERHAERCYNV